jgi:hypothetical protein
LKTFSPKKNAKTWAFFAQTAANFSKNLSKTFLEERHFCSNIGKIEETCDHNINPGLG